MAIAGDGKDTVAGHWELAGCKVNTRFRDFPTGFPEELMAAFEQEAGCGWLGNVAASGTAIIEELGAEHLQTKKPIVYTSADSVFQIAAHEEIIPLAELYRICEAAFRVVAPYGIARVIARPFIGSPGAFIRTENRRDFAQTPPRPTLMDQLQKQGIPTVSIGKVKNIYGDKGFNMAIKAGNNTTITQALLDSLDGCKSGLIFANLVDFDMKYGHRRDPEGYAAALEAFDQKLPELLQKLSTDDLLFLTADHGNDPTFQGNDHTREYVPILAYSLAFPGRTVGTRATLADCGATLGAWLGVSLSEGSSLLDTPLDAPLDPV
jgi:phosphopentomutase